MAGEQWRGARLVAAPLVVLAVATACSGSHSTPTAAIQPPTTAATNAASSDPAAVRIVARAVAATRALRSYTFDATETVAANQQVHTHITGRVVRGQGIAYDLVTGARHTQVVRVTGATYVRAVPGRWARLAHPSQVADPTASLLTILAGMTALSRSDATTVHGALPEPEAKKAGIPTDGRPAHVTVTTDRQGLVTAVDVSTSTAAGARSVTVTVITSYAGFDRATVIRRPG
jgi:hypothetical protein